MKSNTFEALIGAVVIIFTLIFLFFGFQSMRLNNEGNYNVSAVFNRIDGIKLDLFIFLSASLVSILCFEEIKSQLSAIGNNFLSEIQIRLVYFKFGIKVRILR